MTHDEIRAAVVAAPEADYGKMATLNGAVAYLATRVGVSSST
jgi:hypothetical protein